MSARLFFGLYLVLFAVCAINPYDRPVWWAENIPIMLLMAIAAWVHCKHHRFTALSFAMMSVFIALHTIGGHFTFARVPFGFITELFDFERNHYDRIAHFTVGFFAYPIADILQRRKLVNTSWLLFLFPIFSIVTLAAMYEMFEWGFANYADAEAGIAVLGAQGDIWDAQKDMLADTLGACLGMLVFTWWGIPHASSTASSSNKSL
jgi:putative membrane protein